MGEHTRLMNYKKAFIQRYCPPFVTAKQLEDIHNFKQEGDESLYQAWKRYNDLLYKCPTHDINIHQKVGCQIYKGPHLDKDCSLNEEVKQVEEVRYGELGRTTPFNRNNVGRQILAETIKKYTEEASMRQEAVTKTDKNKDCKAIFTNDGAPLYTLFYQSPEDIEYFSANSGFSNDNEFKNVTSIPDKDLKQTSPKQTTTHYIELQSDEYPKFMKDLVANKPLTMENEDVRINCRCSALLLNQLPLKEKDPGSFIPPCSIVRLDFNNALVDLGASINIMPFFMYKHLGIGKLETIKMNIELTDISKCIPKGIVRNLLIKIDKFILPIDFIVLDVLEDFRMPVILGRPLLATAQGEQNQYVASVPS
ncbi:hypothetical protein Tco_0281144 [Tanacetum coccineum]